MKRGRGLPTCAVLTEFFAMPLFHDSTVVVEVLLKKACFDSLKASTKNTSFGETIKKKKTGE